nr:MAG TPA: hypothetical protein [Caudoviricetes sp.]
MLSPHYHCLGLSLYCLWSLFAWCCGGRLLVLCLGRRVGAFRLRM